MAITKSAKKALRVAKRRHIFNLRRKKGLKDAVKGVEKLVAAKSTDAAASLPALYKAIDKAHKSGTIKKNTAARMKSRITKRVASIAR